MDHTFWLQTWREGRIGFHRDTPLPLLTRHWPHLEVPADTRVLVPLCGKTPDMMWLCRQGHHVLGVELSPLAVEQFFATHDLVPETATSAMGTHYRADGIEIIQGDIFTLDDRTLATCGAVYDRAAIVALPPDMRRRYVETVYDRLAPGTRALLVTLEYAQAQMDGPPFSVTADMLGTLFDARWHIRTLDRRDILASEPGFRRRGLTSLYSGVYQLDRSTISS